MEKVFVTGTPGWLGNQVVKGLIQGLSDFPDLPRASFVRCLVLPGMDTSELQKIPHIEIVKGDITDPETLKGLLNGCDTVLHCAGLIHPKKIQDLYKVNTEGTKNVLHEAIQSGVKRFVAISSNSPAGVNLSREKLMTENDPYQPYKHYGKSKMLAEKILMDAHQSKKIETVILRPCWFYGPGQPARQSEFFVMIKKGHPPLFGDGHNLRSMSYIDHVVQGLILGAIVPKAAGEIYWIADERPYETIEIYQTLAELLEVKNLKFLKIPGIVSECFEIADTILQTLGIYNTKIHVAGEMNKNIACSVEKAKRELGFDPKITLKEGMQRSLSWCRDHGQII